MRLLILAAALASGPVLAQPSPPPDAAPVSTSRADDMALLLGLRPDQRPALDELLAATMPPARAGEERGGPPDPARMQARLDAAQRFRTTLSPDQQARFDALERLRHGTGGRRRWGGERPE